MEALLQLCHVLTLPPDYDRGVDLLSRLSLLPEVEIPKLPATDLKMRTLLKYAYHAVLLIAPLLLLVEQWPQWFPPQVELSWQQFSDLMHHHSPSVSHLDVRFHTSLTTDYSDELTEVDGAEPTGSKRLSEPSPPRCEL